MIERGRLSIVYLDLVRRIRALGMVQLLGVVLLNYFRKTDIAKNVVLRWELVSFPYGASAVHRSFRETSEVSLGFFKMIGLCRCLSKLF